MNPRVVSWIDAGKQVGTTLECVLSGEKAWSSVAVQMRNGVYNVYVDEVRDRKMATDEYDRAELKQFLSVREAAGFVDSETHARFDDLRPCKGQRIFELPP